MSAMKRRMSGGMNNYQEPTAQAKLVNASGKFGNKGLRKMQGSTVVVYDSLLLTAGYNPAGTLLTFFENAASRIFPFTNMMEGRLPVGTGFVLERMWFTIMRVNVAVPLQPELIDVVDFTTAALAGLYKSDFQFNNANNTVIKFTPLTKQKPEWNQKAWSTVNNVIHLDTDITIQPLIEFTTVVKLPGITVPAGANQLWMQCYLEGSGAILNPRTNF